MASKIPREHSTAPPPQAQDGGRQGQARSPATGGLAGPGSAARALASLGARLMEPIVRLHNLLAQLATTASGQSRQEDLVQEMDLARQVQQSLLPAAELQLGQFVCAGTYRAAAEVGGDYYDVFPLSGDRVGLVIADVSSKGLGGCMVTAMLAVLLRAIRENYESPAAVLIALEQHLRTSLRPGTFVTIFYGILEPSSGGLTYASAAHCPLLLYRQDSNCIEWRRTGGVPLGALSGLALARSLEDYTLELKPGDLAMLFTDGLNEAWHAGRDELYGYERIAETVAATEAQGQQAVMDALCRNAQQWSAPDQLEDDLTLLTIVHRGTSTTRPTTPTAPSAVEARWFTPDQQLQEMLSDVPRLTLNAALEELDRLRPWLDTCPGIRSLSSERAMAIESGLYEVCANIIEHGYDCEPDHEIEIWWVASGADKAAGSAPQIPPSSETSSIKTSSIKTSSTNTSSTEASGGVGYFVICDQGRAFDRAAYQPPDLSNPADRKRSRGLGMQILHSTANKVVQVANTPAGNLTMLHFDPPERLRKETIPHD